MNGHFVVSGPVMAGLLTSILVALVPAAPRAQEEVRGVAGRRAGAGEAARPFARLTDGTPDLQGIWDRTQTSHDIEEHPASYGVPAGKTMIIDPPDGKVPYLPGMHAKKEENFETKIDPLSFCLPAGVVRFAYPPGGFQIVQSPGAVLFLLDASHAFRIVPLDERPHVGQNIGLWMGDSRGYWDGDTLVVDVTNSNGKTWLDVAGNFFTPALHVVERWTPVDANTLRYEATLDDPNVYSRPWKLATILKRNLRKDYELLETACVEGDRDLDHLKAAYAAKARERADKTNNKRRDDR
jgi:hypothetical protein